MAKLNSSSIISDRKTLSNQKMWKNIGEFQSELAAQDHQKNPEGQIEREHPGKPLVFLLGVWKIKRHN